MTIILTILIYFCLLLIFSRLTSKRATNDTFFRGNKRSPWYMVAFGMVGASISGVTFVSVPGMVNTSGMTYLQTCLGFIIGYFVVSFVLLPIYYKLNLTSIYTYLDYRLGKKAYKTGAWFFLLSKTIGASVRFYIVCMILQEFVLQQYGIPFWLTALCLVSLIWFYTRRGGIKTLVWTDTFQTLCMFTALLLIIYNVIGALNMNISEAWQALLSDERSKIFVFDDILSKQNFWKQFISGIFIVVVMTGLDQDMMQKNLTCKTLRAAQKDMCSYGFAFVPANFLFLALGILLSILTQRAGISLPTSGDELLPMFAASGHLGNIVVVLFTLGIVAASFSSADSAITALTTSFCIDIKQQPHNEKLRRNAHLAIALVFVIFIEIFRVVNSTSVIDAIYILCSYTYGPLLGLFSFALFTRWSIKGQAVPYVAISAPIICFILDTAVSTLTSYKFGYELLMINGIITFLGLYSFREKKLTHKY